MLPFANLGSDADDEGFSDGLTEEVTTKLGSIRGLNVVARTSVLAFKGKHESAGTVSKALHVDHFLEGSVRRSGARIRISAQLIDARQDKHIWAQTFDRDAGDIFQIQDEIAFAIAAALKVSLLDEEESRIRRRGTTDPEAYRLYWIAYAHLMGRAGAGSDINVAKRSLDAAIERDPNFARAQALLARYYFRRAWGALSDSDENARLGIAAAERAVALDPKLTDALMVRADFEFWRYRFRGDYSAYISAYADMNRAIELDPSNAAVFYSFGDAIIWHEPEHASSLLEHSIELDPLCTGNNIIITTLLGNRGQLEAARKRCADLNDRFLSQPVCDMALGTLDTYFGHFPEAVSLLRAGEKAIKGPARIELWSVYMSLGDRVGAEQWLDFGNNPFEKPLSDAARFAMDGQYEQAFTVLEQHRAQFPFSRLLDLPTAKFALIAGKHQQALEILKQRLPDLTGG
ncbi:MAG: hypothetical protein JO358_14180, partial [Alphaproteobacteria bacterium]|nr:hypothetical protein [Alphaproteobacteria bacterium]